MKVKTALLIIDIQNDYFNGGNNPLCGAIEASLNAQQILQHFRQKTMPVVHIQHVANRNGATFFVPNTLGVEIHDNVKPIDGEKVIVKHFPNSFRETQLKDYLQLIGADNLVVCGMMTQMCVDATVRAAKDLGYNITLIADACATKDLSFGEKIVRATDVQTAFMAALSYFYAQVVTTTEYIKKENNIEQ